mmetsp:Transcript_5513/g.5693  ORF Transcript_5513/g.5693 Transcript_5513/m.5693 type:complete len:214 (-) Transcript_5513:34-675(-)
MVYFNALRVYYISIALLVVCNLQVCLCFKTLGISLARNYCSWRSLYTPNYSSNPKITTDPDLESFLSGSLNKEWNGSTNMLERRGQIPKEEYGPKDVIRICLSALQHNDDPQLDHGACVVLAFKSPTGVLSQNNLDPAAYGRFLRSTEYIRLTDFSSVDLIGDMEVNSEDNDSVRQTVRVCGWKTNGVIPCTDFDFYLSKAENLWLMDAILKR